MLEVKCDICNEICNPFHIYKLKETPCEIQNHEIVYSNEYFCDGGPLRKDLYICEKCKDNVNRCIIALMESSDIRVNNSHYSEKEDRV